MLKPRCLQLHGVIVTFQVNFIKAKQMGISGGELGSSCKPNEIKERQFHWGRTGTTAVF